MKLNYVVVGTGRSGTVFMARLLTSVGIPCSHEMLFDYSGLDKALKRMNGESDLELSWTSRSIYLNNRAVEIDPWLSDLTAIQAEASFMAVPFLNNAVFDDCKVIHVVRDPVKVVNSFCNYIDYFKSGIPTNAYETFIYEQIPELKDDLTQYDRAALYCVKWNQMIERHKVDLFHKIEDGPDSVMSFLGKSGPHFQDDTINTYKARSVSKDRFCIDRIKNRDIFKDFVAMGRRYGYPMKSEYLFI